MVCVAGVPPFEPAQATGPAYMYALIVGHVEARIAAGDLAPGARLPGERDLAAEYGVALGTIRRAIAELRSRGAVVTLPAKGTFVVGPDAST